MKPNKRRLQAGAAAVQAEQDREASALRLCELGTELMAWDYGITGLPGYSSGRVTLAQGLLEVLSTTQAQSWESKNSPKVVGT